MSKPQTIPGLAFPILRRLVKRVVSFNYPCPSSAGSPTPYWVALVVAEQKRVRALHQFTCKDHIRCTLRYLRTCNSNLIAFVETDAHLVLKRFGGKIDVDLVITVLDDQLREILPSPDRQQIHFIDHSAGFRFRVKVILRQVADCLVASFVRVPALPTEVKTMPLGRIS